MDASLGDYSKLLLFYILNIFSFLIYIYSVIINIPILN